MPGSRMHEEWLRYYFASGRDAKYKVLRLACLYVCLSVCPLAYVKNHSPNFTKFSVYVTCCRGPVFICRRRIGRRRRRSLRRVVDDRAIGSRVELEVSGALVVATTTAFVIVLKRDDELVESITSSA